MRYTKLLPEADCTSCRRGCRCPVRCGTRCNGLWNARAAPAARPEHESAAPHVADAVAAHLDMAPRRESRSSPPGGTAGVRRWCCSSLGLVIGVMFIEWPENTIWNTRFLPFWMLAFAFARGDGRHRDRAVRRDVGHEGLHLDTRRRSPATRAPAPGPRSPPRMSIPTSTRSTPRTRARKRRGHWPIGSSIADRRVGNRRRAARARGRRRIGRRSARSRLPLLWCSAGSSRSTAASMPPATTPPSLIRGWAAWNYAGYEQKADYPQYNAVMTGMEQVADTVRRRPRALGTVVGRSRRDQQLRHEPRVGAAPVLHEREDRFDGGHLLRVVGDDRLPLPHRQRVRAAPVEPGARTRVRLGQLRLRSVRAPPADVGRALLHGVDSGDAEARGSELATQTGEGRSRRTRRSPVRRPTSSSPTGRSTRSRTAISSSASTRNRWCSRRCRRARRTSPIPSVGIRPGTRRTAPSRRCKTVGSARPRRGG